jgi:hypothetical protein
MSPPITATRPVTLGCCVACLTGRTHTAHDTSLAVAQRSSITAPKPRTPNPDIPGYLAEPVPSYPSI